MVSNKAYSLIFVLVLSLGLLFRFYNFPAWQGFDYDQEVNAWIAKAIVIDHKPVLIGPETSTGGMFVGSYFNYIIALFFWLGRMNPTISILLNVLISTATICLIYFAGKLIFNRMTGIIAVIIYSFSSLAAGYDRVLWNPTPVPLVTLGIILGLHQYIKRDQVWYLILATVSVGVALHLHFNAVILAAFYFVSLVLFSLQKTFLNPKRYLVIGGILGIFLFPLVLFDLRHGFLNSRHVWSFFVSSGGGTGQRLYDSLIRSWDIVNGIIVSIFVPEAAGYTLNWILIRVLGILFVLMSLIIIKKSGNLFFKLYLIIFILTVGPFSFYHGPLPGQYFLFLVPVFTLLVSAIFISVWNRSGYLKIISILLICIIILANVRYVLARGEERLNLKNKEAAVEYINNQAGGKAYGVDIITDYGFNTGYRYLLWLYGGKRYKEDKSLGIKEFKIVVPYYKDNSGRQMKIFGDIGVLENR